MNVEEVKRNFLESINKPHDSEWVQSFPSIRKHRLCEELKRSGLKQLDVSNLLGIKFQSLSRMLNGYDVMDKNIEKKIEGIIEIAKGKE